MNIQQCNTPYSMRVGMHVRTACASVCMYRYTYTYRYAQSHEEITRREISPPQITFLEDLRETDVLLLLYQDSCVLQHPGGRIVVGTDLVNSQILEVGDQILGVLAQWTTVQSAAASLQQQQCIKSLQCIHLCDSSNARV